MASANSPAGASTNATPFLHGTEFEALAEALRAGQYGHGVLTETFEHEVAEFLGVPDMVAVASGTAALQIGLMLAGIGPGDEVIVPSQTFCATVQSIVAVGASPRFIEVSPASLCVEPEDVLAAVTPATRAVMPVLYGGRAVDLTAVQDVLDDRGITVVEDAAQAFGSYFGTRLVGSTGALTCFSFGPIKNLTCGEGGGLVPRNPEEAAAARRIRLLGIDQSQADRIRSTSYQVASFGLRAPMSSLHAAIGSAQLARFPEVEARRKDLWRTYAADLAELDGVALIDVDIDRTVPFNCVVRIPDRDLTFETLRDQSIGVGVHYPPNHLQLAFSRWHRKLPVTESLARQVMSLPFHPAMTTTDVHHVTTALARALRSVPALAYRSGSEGGR
ncbi:DegT/DnrJ/EryC1/StrS family aminotransferase [Kitasatospora kazusensis]|uniref:DegT/DnrJ/EryC1/StrS family aminotransferase n=1 Tax=Kitasatospora kazusensis TaxID=407974 RepID=A0ABN1ZLM2_9ACTN